MGNQSCVGGKLSERGTAEFYRREAARLKAHAALATTPAAKVKLLEMASVFRRMADHASLANRNQRNAPDAESA